MAELTEACARSEYACIFCKRRKVKCDRTLPFCSICRRSRQECEYPVEAGKPGPKLGSTRGSRKRASSCSPEARAIRSTAQVRPKTTNFNAIVTQNTTSLDGPTECSAEVTESATEYYPLTPATTPLDVHTLAYIVHPSHDIASITTAEQEMLDVDMTGGNTAIGNSHLVTHACSLLDITVEAMHAYINLYFDNMTSFSLFHQPSFESKIQSIKSAKELAALLASMFSFSARFKSASEPASYDLQDQNSSTIGLSHSPHHFESLTQQYVDEVFSEYSDELPSLCIVQALILLTFKQLAKGVRGNAWRRLGLCIRTAYELQLHHVDRDNFMETNDVAAWCDLEERRRAWWAIWEMDIFASTIKRCPGGIDWTDNETRLPAPDEYWYKREVFQSCFLEVKPMDRVTALRQCGNKSAKAWFLVLNSFMREGHVISKYRSARPGNGRHSSTKTSLKNTLKDTSDSLVILANALKCFSMALPKQLRYGDEYLSFTSRDPTKVTTTRQMHCAKYSIHVTTQLTRFMIHHHDAFGGALQDLHLSGAANEGKQNSAPLQSEAISLHLGPTRKGLQQYMEAADELLAIVSRSSDDHVRYVNPFLASTIWYGAAVHLSWKVLAPPNLNLDFIHSKFEVMRMCFDEYTAFWALTNALHENLQSMEQKLTKFISSRNKNRASARSHNQSKAKKRSASSVDQINLSAEIQATQIETMVGDDNTAAGLQNIYRPSFNNYADVNTNASLIEVDGLQTSPRSMDAFNFDDLLTADNSGQTESHFINSISLWSDLGLDLEFAMNPQDFPQGFLNYNYAEEGREDTIYPSSAS